MNRQSILLFLVFLSGALKNMYKHILYVLLCVCVCVLLKLNYILYSVVFSLLKEMQIKTTQRYISFNYCIWVRGYFHGIKTICLSFSMNSPFISFPCVFVFVFPVGLLTLYLWASYLLEQLSVWYITVSFQFVICLWVCLL